MEKIEVKVVRRGRPRKVKQNELKSNDNIMMMNPFDLFKSCSLTYDSMNGVNWDGAVYNEKILILLKTKDSNNNFKYNNIVARGLKEFERTHFYTMYHSLRLTTESNTMEDYKNTLIEKLNNKRYAVVKGSNDSSAYLFKISNNPFITEFQASGLLRFLNKGYTDKQICNKVISTLEFFGEDISEFNNNGSITEYLFIRKVGETITVNSCNRKSLECLIMSSPSQSRGDELKQICNKLDIDGYYYEYTDDGCENDYIVIIEYKVSSNSKGIDFKKLAEYQDKYYCYRLDEMVYEIRIILDGLYVLSPEYKEEDKNDK